MTKYFIIIVLFVFLLFGCNKKTLNIISKDSLYERGLEYTLIENLAYKNEVKAIINITYLNPSNPNIYDNEFDEFLFGVYISNENSSLENKNYILKLNSKNIFNKIELKSNHELFNHIPVKNHYAKYYIVKFKKSKETTLKITYSHSKYGIANIQFKKF